MKARERLWLTADRERLVPDGHRDAATLYAAAGDEIPEDAARRFGLEDGRLRASGGSAAKAARDTGDKESKDGGEDKSESAEAKPAEAPAKAGGLSIRRRNK